MLYQRLDEYCGQFYVLKCESSYEILSYTVIKIVSSNILLSRIFLYPLKYKNFEYSFPVLIGDR